MKIETLTLTDDWEDMTCDDCGANDWEIAETYEDDEPSTAFYCSKCGEPGPIVKDSQWCEIE